MLFSPIIFIWLSANGTVRLTAFYLRPSHVLVVALTDALGSPSANSNM